VGFTSSCAGRGSRFRSAAGGQDQAVPVAPNRGPGKLTPVKVRRPVKRLPVAISLDAVPPHDDG